MNEIEQAADLIYEYAFKHITVTEKLLEKMFPGINIRESARDIINMIYQSYVVEDVIFTNREFIIRIPMKKKQRLFMYHNGHTLGVVMAFSLEDAKRITEGPDEIIEIPGDPFDNIMERRTA